MYDSDSKGISYTAAFFMLIAFAVAGLVMASLIALPVWSAMTGKPVTAFQKEMINPAYSGAAKVVQAIQAIFGFLLPAIMTAFLVNKRPMRLLGFSTQIKASQVGWVIVAMIAAVYLSTSLAWFTSNIPVPASWKTWFDTLESNYNKQLEAIIRLDGKLDFILGVIVMAFLPALCEEAMFRGGLQNFLSRATQKPWLSIIIVSLIFSVVHLSYYGFLVRFFLGIVLGLIYYYSGRLWLSVLAHFINNALAITALYVAKMYKIDLEVGGYWGFLALPILVAALMVFRRVSFNTKNSYA